jgi:hypothetical protein
MLEFINKFVTAADICAHCGLHIWFVNEQYVQRFVQHFVCTQLQRNLGWFDFVVARFHPPVVHIVYKFSSVFQFGDG